MEVDGEYVAFDRSAVEVKNMVDKYFGGDGLKFVKKAYEESTRIGDQNRYCRSLRPCDKARRNNGYF